MVKEDLMKIIKEQAQIIATLVRLLDKDRNPPVMMQAEEFEAWAKTSKDWK